MIGWAGEEGRLIIRSRKTDGTDAKTNLKIEEAYFV
jgi:hypothetical protein